MRTTTTTTATAVLVGVGVAQAFSSLPAFTTGSSTRQTSTTTELRMGLFDGVKDAFSAPALERSTLDAERETPIDRWMGWSVARDGEEAAQSGELVSL